MQGGEALSHLASAVSLRRVSSTLRVIRIQKKSRTSSIDNMETRMLLHFTGKLDKRLKINIIY